MRARCNAACSTAVAVAASKASEIGVEAEFERCPQRDRERMDDHVHVHLVGENVQQVAIVGHCG
jgi:hypothetical protein